MRRVWLVVIVGAVLAVGVGCSGYREMARPWNGGAVEDEFSTASRIRAGDRVRVTTVEGGVACGVFVESDAVALTVADTAGGVHLVTTPVERIQRLEVYQSGLSGKTAWTVAAVGSISAIIYAIVESESDGKFHPDSDSPTASDQNWK